MIDLASSTPLHDCSGGFQFGNTSPSQRTGDTPVFPALGKHRKRRCTRRCK
eukprot:CAMPEP_0194053698 /NCGR_PEP_ID=MMETSP0009_2-20130614/50887_1 /TAXON_ID=210454 /ORGANISM="Grammatophora oceanica, Strain CCMP 410" /LENGTH=50 /DNA_ID=CAMNT_0038701913 /DNA_START=48 /DNA_END=197 /DNA_ORIENTATION=-